MGKSLVIAVKRSTKRNNKTRSCTWAKRIYIWRLLSSCRGPLKPYTDARYVVFCVPAPSVQARHLRLRRSDPAWWRVRARNRITSLNNDENRLLRRRNEKNESGRYFIVVNIHTTSDSDAAIQLDDGCAPEIEKKKKNRPNIRTDPHGEGNKMRVVIILLLWSFTLPPTPTQRSNSTTGARHK